jgi:hypothetical protein
VFSANVLEEQYATLSSVSFLDAAPSVMGSQSYLEYALLGTLTCGIEISSVVFNTMTNEEVVRLT